MLTLVLLINRANTYSFFRILCLYQVYKCSICFVLVTLFERLEIVYQKYILTSLDMLVVVCCVTEWSSGGSRKIDSQSEKISYFTRIFTSIQFSSNGSLVYWPKVILHFGTKIYRLALPKAGFQKMFAFQLFFIIKYQWWCPFLKIHKIWGYNCNRCSARHLLQIITCYWIIILE